MGKANQDLNRDERNSGILRNSNNHWKPICRTEKRSLGSCMPYEEADRIAREHESKTDHAVDLEKC
jgi:hypothetical protein